MFKTTTTFKQAWPPVTITVDPDGRAFEFALATGAKIRAYAGTLEASRTQGAQMLVDWAKRLRRPLIASVTDSEGSWHVKAEPDGRIWDMAEVKTK